MLQNVAEANGYKTLSGYIRAKIFDGDLAVHNKLNKILERLENGHE